MATAATRGAALALSGVTVAYGGGAPALYDVTLDVPRGSQVAVIGPNGAGKTTLFNAILGLVRLARGSVRVFGRPPRAQRGLIAYIPQREEIDWSFPLTALDIALMGRARQMGWRLRPRPADVAAAREALARVGMAKEARTPIAELSGGQQQRLVIARALAQDAPLFLLDEPFNEVDGATQALLLDLFDELVRQGRTLLVSTHDLELARRRFPRVLLLNRTVVGYGPPAELLTPEILQRTYMRRGGNGAP